MSPRTEESWGFNLPMPPTQLLDGLSRSRLCPGILSQLTALNCRYLQHSNHQLSTLTSNLEALHMAPRYSNWSFSVYRSQRLHFHTLDLSLRVQKHGVSRKVTSYCTNRDFGGKNVFITRQVWIFVHKLRSAIYIFPLFLSNQIHFWLWVPHPT